MKEMTSTSNFMAHDETDILKLHHATIESGLQRELGKMTVEVHELQAELTSTSDALIAERK